MMWFLLLVLVLFYMIPTAVAAERSHYNLPAICALNILLGWTFLGWVAAFVWALTPAKRQLTTDEIIAEVRKGQAH